MKRTIFFGAILAIIGITVLSGQPRLDIHSVGVRVLCIVPMVGTGTYDDPMRPLFAPAKGGVERETPGIVSFRYEVSDDGKTALVELVAPTREALKAVLESSRSGVRVFERGKATKEEIEAAFRQHKKDFDAEKFQEGKR